MSAFPARVHIILAREAPVAIIIRRGPAKAVCTLLWDRQRDEFSLGQWLRGRIYERRCDLSPDGEHFIYFAMTNRAAFDLAPVYTAVSRAPWLKAIGLWTKDNAWEGGGLFLSNDTYWINDDAPYSYLGHEEKYAPAGMQRGPVPPLAGSYGRECLGVYFIRLQRDGWKLTFHSREAKLSLFEKPLPDGWTLRKTSHAGSPEEQGRGCYYDTHSLHHPHRADSLDFPEWSWADLDGERLVWVTKGILFASRLDAEGPSHPQQLYDFNPMAFEAIPAPYARPDRPSPKLERKLKRKTTGPL